MEVSEIHDLAERIKRATVRDLLTIAVQCLDQHQPEIAEQVIRIAHEKMQLARLLAPPLARR